MPRATTKKGKAKAPKGPEGEHPNGNLDGSAPAVAVAEPPPELAKQEPSESAQPNRGDGKAAEDKDKIAATSLNIAKLQAMSMTELNQMARELNVENFGTMRKHEVIFHILQKNAERAGVLFS